MSFVLEDLPEFADGSVQGHAVRLLRRHFAVHGVGAAAVEPFATLLAAHWPGYLELLVSDAGDAVALAITGRGREFAARLAALLAVCEISPPLAHRMLAISGALNDGRCTLRLELAAGNAKLPQVSVLQRRPLALEHGLGLLNAQPAVLEQVRACARLLQQRCIHGIALTATAQQLHLQTAVRFVQVLTARRRETVRMRLAYAASRYAACASAVTVWAEHHDSWLTREVVPLSLWLAPGIAESSEVRIEYPDVSVPAAVGWLGSQAPIAQKRFAQLCASAGRSRLSYLEVSLPRAKVPRLYGAVRLA